MGIRTNKIGMHLIDKGRLDLGNLFTQIQSIKVVRLKTSGGMNAWLREGMNNDVNMKVLLKGIPLLFV